MFRQQLVLVSDPPFPLERIEEMTALMGGQGELPEQYKNKTEEE